MPTSRCTLMDLTLDHFTIEEDQADLIPND